MAVPFIAPLVHLIHDDVTDSIEIEITFQSAQEDTRRTEQQSGQGGLQVQDARGLASLNEMFVWDNPMHINLQHIHIVMTSSWSEAFIQLHNI